MKSIVEKLFPLKGVVTQEILSVANKDLRSSCPGARALRNALGDNVQYLNKVNGLMWFNQRGILTFTDNSKLVIDTIQHVQFMYQGTPINVTFIIVQDEKVN